MILWIAMRITELLLALTLYRCKCELFLAAIMGTCFLRHPYSYRRNVGRQFYTAVTLVGLD